MAELVNVLQEAPEINALGDAYASMGVEKRQPMLRTYP